MKETNRIPAQVIVQQVHSAGMDFRRKAKRDGADCPLNGVTTCCCSDIVCRGSRRAAKSCPAGRTYLLVAFALLWC